MTVRCTALMPMGGLGQRFRDAGWEVPKPLIEVDGRPMFLRALESLPAPWEVEHVFVVRADQEREYGVSDLIRAACPDARFAILDHDTRGAVETCLEARSIMDLEIPVVVLDCDIRLRSAAYERMAASDEWDGILASFQSQDPRYSYAELGPNGAVVRTAEKVPISNHALLGGYWFRSGDWFLSLADRFLAQGLPEGLKEYYLSHLFNIALAGGAKVGLAEVDGYDIWGTPEELTAYVSREASQ